MDANAAFRAVAPQVVARARAGKNGSVNAAPQMVASMEGAIANRMRNQADPALTGQPTTTPSGWVMGRKSGWRGAPRPPGIINRPRFKHVKLKPNKQRPDINIGPNGSNGSYF